MWSVLGWRVGAAIVAVMAAAGAEAQTVPSGPLSGVGEWLLDRGVHLGFDYVGNGAAVVAGGIKQGDQYAGVLELGSDLDLQRIAGVPNTVIHVKFSDTVGHSVSTKDVGNLGLPEEVPTNGETYRLSELSVDTALLDDRVELLVGRIANNGEFAVVPAFCGFQTNPVCTHLPVFENVDLQSYPYQVWGGRIRVKPAPRYTIAAGAFENDPFAADRGHHGFDFTTKYARGVTIPLELGYSTTAAMETYPRDYKIGGYYDTGNFFDPVYDGAGAPFPLAHRAPANHQGRAGAYAVFDQAIYRPDPDPSSARSLSLFGGVATNQDKPELLNWTAMLGLFYRGPFAARPNDVTGFVVSDEKLSGREITYLTVERALAGGNGSPRSNEIVFNLNYGFIIGSTMRLTPYVDYVINPDNINVPLRRASTPDALVIGLTFRINLGSILGIPTQPYRHAGME